MTSTTPSCCKDMADSLALRQPLIRRNDTGLWLVSIGYSNIDGACAWADFPLLFCPYCGAEAQARPDVRARNGASIDGRHCCRFRERAAEVCEHPTLVDGMIAVGYQAVEGVGTSYFEVLLRFCPFCGGHERAS